jgi:hypothetical protein
MTNTEFVDILLWNRNVGSAARTKREATRTFLLLQNNSPNCLDTSRHFPYVLGAGCD